MSKKYFAICKGKKRKYGDCKDLLPKYIINNNYYDFFKLLRLIFIFKMLFYIPLFGLA